MKKFIGLLILLGACSGPKGDVGQTGVTGSQGLPGVGCSTQSVAVSELVPTGGALITCGVTSTLLVNGAKGDKGDTGAQGEQGNAGQNGSNGASAYDLWLQAGNEGSLSDYLNSLVGPQGEQGQTGATAQGPQGLQGPAGSPTAYDIVQLIYPCGNNVAYKEVLLRLENGTILASFSDNENGKDTRLAVIVPGSYVDTDDSNCHFNVDNNGNVTW